MGVRNHGHTFGETLFCLRTVWYFGSGEPPWPRTDSAGGHWSHSDHACTEDRVGQIENPGKDPHCR